ncbi:hypothetical protein AB2L28_13635 [Kineococcus sp. TBRC 1896]|uniref:Uncharacterized protein n=1 Tax=Kineococcus mangrovi TaxID=1660183 RepID=A0ABV4I3L8_9ACTN
MDSTLWAGIIAGAVGVVALFVQGRQNRVSTTAAAEQNCLTLAAAEQANRDTQVAAARGAVGALPLGGRGGVAVGQPQAGGGWVGGLDVVVA